MSVPSDDASGLTGTDVQASHVLSHTSSGTPSGRGYPQIFLPAGTWMRDAAAPGAWRVSCRPVVETAPAVRTMVATTSSLCRRIGMFTGGLVPGQSRGRHDPCGAAFSGGEGITGRGRERKMENEEWRTRRPKPKTSELTYCRSSNSATSGRWSLAASASLERCSRKAVSRSVRVSSSVSPYEMAEEIRKRLDAASKRLRRCVGRIPGASSR